MDTDVIVAIIAGSVSVAVALVGLFSFWGENKRLKQARRLEREASFERAQTGYRALYRKFAKNYENAARAGEGFDTVRPDLYEDFYEAQTVGFTELKTALEGFWPTNQRLAGKPFSGERWDNVAKAFLKLTGLTLKEWENLQKPPQRPRYR